jgi:hypothetical protein
MFRVDKRIIIIFEALVYLSYYEEMSFSSYFYLTLNLKYSLVREKEQTQ